MDDQQEKELYEPNKDFIVKDEEQQDKKLYTAMKDFVEKNKEDIFLRGHHQYFWNINTKIKEPSYEENRGYKKLFGWDNIEPEKSKESTREYLEDVFKHFKLYENNDLSKPKKRILTAKQGNFYLNFEFKKIDTYVSLTDETVVKGNGKDLEDVVLKMGVYKKFYRFDLVSYGRGSVTDGMVPIEDTEEFKNIDPVTKEKKPQKPRLQFIHTDSGPYKPPRQPRKKKKK